MKWNKTFPSKNNYSTYYAIIPNVTDFKYMFLYLASKASKQAGKNFGSIQSEPYPVGACSVSDSLLHNGIYLYSPWNLRERLMSERGNSHPLTEIPGLFWKRRKLMETPRLFALKQMRKCTTSGKQNLKMPLKWRRNLRRKGFLPMVIRYRNVRSH